MGKVNYLLDVKFNYLRRLKNFSYMGYDEIELYFPGWKLGEFLDYVKSVDEEYEVLKEFNSEFFCIEETPCEPTITPKPGAAAHKRSRRADGLHKGRDKRFLWEEAAEVSHMDKLKIFLRGVKLARVEDGLEDLSLALGSQYFDLVRDYEKRQIVYIATSHFKALRKLRKKEAEIKIARNRLLEITQKYPKIEKDEDYSIYNSKKRTMKPAPKWEFRDDELEELNEVVESSVEKRVRPRIEKTIHLDDSILWEKLELSSWAMSLDIYELDCKTRILKKTDMATTGDYQYEEDMNSWYQPEVEEENFDLEESDAVVWATPTRRPYLWETEAKIDRLDGVNWKYLAGCKMSSVELSEDVNGTTGQVCFTTRFPRNWDFAVHELQVSETFV